MLLAKDSFMLYFMHVVINLYIMAITFILLQLSPLWQQVVHFTPSLKHLHFLVAQVDLHLYTATTSASLLNFLAASLNVSKASLSQPSTSVMFKLHFSSSSVLYCVFSTPNSILILWNPLLIFTMTPGILLKSSGPLSWAGTWMVTASPISYLITYFLWSIVSILHSLCSF